MGERPMVLIGSMKDDCKYTLKEEQLGGPSRGTVDERTEQPGRPEPEQNNFMAELGNTAIQNLRENLIKPVAAPNPMSGRFRILRGH